VAWGIDQLYGRRLDIGLAGVRSTAGPAAPVQPPV